MASARLQRTTQQPAVGAALSQLALGLERIQGIVATPLLVRGRATHIPSAADITAPAGAARGAVRLTGSAGANESDADARERAIVSAIYSTTSGIQIHFTKGPFRFTTIYTPCAMKRAC